MEQATLRKLQLVEAEMLADVAKVCEENNIQYYMISGTLLGAVRHNGFIPWDDDIDISMFYDDYLRFLEIAPEALGDKYFVQNSDTDPAFYRPFTKICKNGTAMGQKIFLKKYSAHQGIWLDIFPMVWMNSHLEVKIKRILLRIANYIAMDDYMSVQPKLFDDLFGKLRWLLHLVYKIPENIRKRIKKRLTKCVFGKKKKGKYVVVIWPGINNSSVCDPACFDGPPQKLRFEEYVFDAPYNTDMILRTIYGDNYMTPIKYSAEQQHGDLIVDFENDYSIYSERTIDEV